MIEYSEDFSDAYWVKSGSTVDVNKVTKAGTSSNDRILISNLSILNTTDYTLSAFIKNDDIVNGGVSTISARVSGGTLFRQGYEWNGSTLSITSSQTNGTRTNVLLEDFGNGWWKIGFTFDSDGTSTNIELDIDRVNGTDTTSLYLRSTQLEQASSAGNYILTDGAAAIDVTTIQNPTNKGYDILGNALRLRENAFNLDGSGYGEIADSDSLDFGTGDFTVECWATYKFENTGSGLNVIISNGLASSSGTLGFNLLTNSADFAIRLGDGVNVYTHNVASSPIENDWYYIAFTRVGTTLTVYVDDVDGVDYTDADIAVDVSTTKPLMIGRDERTDRYYKGLIDEPRLYNRALTQKEITNNYKIGLRTHS